MSWERADSFLRKSEILYEQAVRDAELGMYEKAVSAFYFSVEAAVSALSLRTQGSVPRGYRTRLAFLARVDEELALDFDRMHLMRVRADHWDDLMGEGDARRQRELADTILSRLRPGR